MRHLPGVWEKNFGKKNRGRMLIELRGWLGRTLKVLYRRGRSKLEGESRVIKVPLVWGGKSILQGKTQKKKTLRKRDYHKKENYKGKIQMYQISETIKNFRRKKRNARMKLLESLALKTNRGGTCDRIFQEWKRET